MTVYQAYDYSLCNLEVTTLNEKLVLGGCDSVQSSKGITKYQWQFDDDENFFLGLGGYPKENWVSIAPLMTGLIADNTVLDLVPSFTLEEQYEFYLSPPDVYYGQEAVIKFPGFTQVRKCVQSTSYGQERSVLIWEKDDELFDFYFPDYMTASNLEVLLDLSNTQMASVDEKIQYAVTLNDYRDEVIREIQVFDIVIKNPCNDGNRVILRDTSKQYTQTVKTQLDRIMVKWTTQTYRLDEMFTDAFSQEGGLGLCGELEYEIFKADEAPFLDFDPEKKILTISTDQDELVGDYKMEAQARLKDFPLSTPMDVEFELTIIDREIEIEYKQSAAGWICAFLFTVMALVGGFFLGKRYQDKLQKKVTEIGPSPTKIPSDPKERIIKQGDVSQAALVMQMSKMSQGSSKTQYIDADWESMPPPEDTDKSLKHEQTGQEKKTEDQEKQDGEKKDGSVQEKSDLEAAESQRPSNNNSVVNDSMANL